MKLQITYQGAQIFEMDVPDQTDIKQLKLNCLDSKKKISAKRKQYVKDNPFKKSIKDIPRCHIPQKEDVKIVHVKGVYSNKNYNY